MVGASQKKSNSSPDPEAVRRLLTSPEGQALLRVLQSDGGKGMQAAVQAMKQGNVEKVKEALSPLLEGSEAEKLTQRLEEKL